MLSDPIGFKYNFTAITNLIWLELEITDITRQFINTVKCGLRGWSILKLDESGFVGAPKLIQNLDVSLHVVDLLKHYLR